MGISFPKNAKTLNLGKDLGNSSPKNAKNLNLGKNPGQFFPKIAKSFIWETSTPILSQIAKNGQFRKNLPRPALKPH